MRRWRRWSRSRAAIAVVLVIYVGMNLLVLMSVEHLRGVYADITVSSPTGEAVQGATVTMVSDNALFPRPDLQPPCATGIDGNASFGFVENSRLKWAWPQWSTVDTGEHTLVIQKEGFADSTVVLPRQTVTLFELWPRKKQLWKVDVQLEPAPPSAAGTG